MSSGVPTLGVLRALKNPVGGAASVTIDTFNNSTTETPYEKMYDLTQIVLDVGSALGWVVPEFELTRDAWNNLCQDNFSDGSSSSLDPGELTAAAAALGQLSKLASEMATDPGSCEALAGLVSMNPLFANWAVNTALASYLLDAAAVYIGACSILIGAGFGLYYFYKYANDNYGGLGNMLNDLLSKIGSALHMTDPLVMDLSGKGINLSALSPSSPYYDFDNTGMSHQTGWVGASTGLLCMVDSDGKTQLFGNDTIDGFTALAALDLNKDGVVSASDSGFSQLRVWVDSNGDGKVEAGELMTLSQLGIASINLNATASDQTIAGNTINSISSFTMEDGSVREIASVSFVESPTYTAPDTPVTISSSIAALPQLPGYGQLLDLHSAMMGDATLATLVTNFTKMPAGSSMLDITNAVQNIMYQWAGVNNVVIGARGSFVNAPQLEFVEKFLGQSFVIDNGLLADPGLRSGAQMEQVWNSLFNQVLANLVLQSPSQSGLLPEFCSDSESGLVLPSELGLNPLQSIYQRLGTPCSTNWGTWELALRVSAAMSNSLGLDQDQYESSVANSTTDEIGSLANAVANNINISFNSLGLIEEIGSSINNVMYAGKGINELFGGGGDSAGNDVFVFNKNDGRLEIDEKNILSATSVNNTLKLGAGIDPASMKVTGTLNGDIVLDFGGGDQVTLDGMLVSSVSGVTLSADYEPTIFKNGWGTTTDDFNLALPTGLEVYVGFSPSINGVQEVKFANGQILTDMQLLQMEMTGTTGCDTLYGTAGADLIDGKGGGDYEKGNGGGDTFVFNSGYGNLEINEIEYGTSVNVLELGKGISASSILVRNDSNKNLIITDGITGDRVQIDYNTFDLNSYGNDIQQVRFFDGSSLNLQQLQNMALQGTPGNDDLFDYIGHEVFDGKGGNDYAQGSGGGDTFVFNSGYGQLEIYTENHGNAANVLELGKNISLATLLCKFDVNGNLILTDGVSTDRILLDYAGNSVDSGVQQVMFSDGTVLSRQQLQDIAMQGTSGDDYLIDPIGPALFDGKGGNDYERGLGNNDTFVFNSGYGHLDINERGGQNQNSVLEFGNGINAASVSVQISGAYNIVLTDGVLGDQVQLDSMCAGNNGVQQVQFADGTVWTAQQILANAYALSTGTLGSDYLLGTEAPTLFDGQGGSDYESGDGNADTFVYNTGYGQLSLNEKAQSGKTNVLRFGSGITAATLKVSSDSTGSLLLTDGDTGDTITVDNMASDSTYGVQQVQFFDGSSLTAHQLLNLAEKTQGSTGNDTLSGTYNAELFDGKGGNDTEYGEGGADTFVFNQGYGQLTINETEKSGQTSTLVMGNLIPQSSLSAAVSGQNLILTDGFSGDQIKLIGMVSSTNNGVQQVQFSDGSVMTAQQLLRLVLDVNGTSGNDNLYGTTGANIFDGKGGSDEESGNGGADTFVFNPGYGSLSIDENQYASPAAKSTLLLGKGISESSLTVTLDQQNQGENLILSDGITGDQITLDFMASSSSYGVQQVQFADGTVWSAQQLFGMVNYIMGTTGNDRLYGSAVQAAYFDGKGGNDYEKTLYCGSTFIFNSGYGQLEIDGRYSAQGTGNNILKLGEISASSVTVHGDGQDGIILTDGVAGDRIQLDEGVTSVQLVQFDDGTVWSKDQLLSMQLNQIGTAGSDTLYGSYSATTLDGMGGGDVYKSINSNDTYIYNADYGNLEIDESHAYSTAAGTLELGKGISETSTSVSFDTTGDLIVTDGIAGDRIQVDQMGIPNFSQEGIQQIQFADGVIWDRQQIFSTVLQAASSGDDDLFSPDSPTLFDGKGGNDIERGSGQGDTFVFNVGYGQLEITEGGSSNTLLFGKGISASSLSASADASGGLIVSDGVAGDRIVLEYAADPLSVQFSDGTTLTGQQLESLAQHPQSTLGNDTLYSPGSTLFDGGGGHDYAQGPAGDTFTFSSGYGQLEINEANQYMNGVNAASELKLGGTITEGSLAASVDASGDLILTDGHPGDQITLDKMATLPQRGIDSGGSIRTGVQQVNFADGTTWTAQQLLSLAQHAQGSSGSDTLYGLDSATTFDGMGGKDLEVGYSGSDSFVFNAGYGQLEINESVTGGGSVLEFGNGISLSSLSAQADADGNIVLTDGIYGDRIQIEGMGSLDGNWGHSGISTVQFSDGTQLAAAQLMAMSHTIYGSRGNDTLTGVVPQQIFDGNGGSDIEQGLGGGDAFTFDIGYGQLEIKEAEISANDWNTLVLGNGITQSSISVHYDPVGNVVLTDGIPGDQIQLDGMYSATLDSNGDPVSGVQQILFADGSMLMGAQLLSMITQTSNPVKGTVANDTLTGSSGIDLFDGKGGNDLEIGNGGSDTYSLQPGYGNLTIVNGVSSSNSVAGDLAISGVSSNQLWLQQVGNDLQVDLMGSNTEATLQGWYSNTYNQLSELTVSGGSGGNLTLNNSQINQLVQAMATFASNNPGFDPTSSINPQITDTTVLAVANSSWH